MSLTDATLIDILKTLTASERRAVALHLRGVRTAESWALMRAIRARLKRRARSRR